MKALKSNQNIEREINNGKTKSDGKKKNALLKKNLALKSSRVKESNLESRAQFNSIILDNGGWPHFILFRASVPVTGKMNGRQKNSNVKKRKRRRDKELVKTEMMVTFLLLNKFFFLCV